MKHINLTDRQCNCHEDSKFIAISKILGDFFDKDSVVSHLRDYDFKESQILAILHIFSTQKVCIHTVCGCKVND